MSEPMIDSAGTGGGAVSIESVVVRSFRQGDREQVLALHQEGVATSLCCNCDGQMDRVQEAASRRHDHLWVAECQGRIVGTLALLLEGEDEVAHLHCLRIANDFGDVPTVRKQLVKAAAAHARNHGSLKLILHANVQETKAAAFLHRLGFEFSRHREVDGRPALEFYLNLYERPELREEG